MDILNMNSLVEEKNDYIHVSNEYIHHLSSDYIIVDNNSRHYCEKCEMKFINPKYVSICQDCKINRFINFNLYNLSFCILNFICKYS